jgi:hypothetical protein
MVAQLVTQKAESFEWIDTGPKHRTHAILSIYVPTQEKHSNPAPRRLFSKVVEWFKVFQMVKNMYGAPGTKKRMPLKKEIEFLA